MHRLKEQALDKVNQIAAKYRFRDDTEIDNDDFGDFAYNFMLAVAAGLNADKEDVEYIKTLRTLAGV